MSQVEIIAEIANAHQGDPDQAKRLAEESLSAGVDAVKFQIYFANELLVKNHPRFDHFNAQSFTPETWIDMISGIKANKGRVYCDVFGLNAFSVAKDSGADGFKIHSSDLNNDSLLHLVAKLDKKVFLSTGGSTIREIVYAVNILSNHGIRPVLLHGFQGYPTNLNESALSRITWLKQYFGEVCDIGYQDHVDADDPFSFNLPIIAIGLGALTIEKHVTLNRSAKGVDYYSSMEPLELANFVKIIRQCETAISSDPESFEKSEIKYRTTVKKHWVSSTNLIKGHILSPSDLIMKRVGDPKPDFVEAHHLLGREIINDLSVDHAVCRADVRTVVWAIVVARSQSSRLPGKALIDVAGMPAIKHLFERLKQAKSIDKILFCTTVNPEDDSLVKIAESSAINYYRGPVEDVLGRMLGAIQGRKVDVIVRVTGDDILVDPDYIDLTVKRHLMTNAEYTDMKALPSGTEAEIFDTHLLKQIHRLAKDSDGTEYLTNYVIHHKNQFRTAQADIDPRHIRDWRLTLDTKEDYEVICTFLESMRDQNKAINYRLDDVIDYFEQNDDVLQKNAGLEQKKPPAQVDTSLLWNRLFEFNNH